jgi:phosphatidylglycerophosphate synthase
VKDTSLGAVATAALLSLASMIVFALRHRGYRDADATRKGSRLLLGIADFLVHWFLWLITPLERILARRGVRPDQLNLAGLVFGAFAGILIAMGRLEAGGWAIAVAGACDVLDGRLARRQGVASAYGKFIDSTLDRFVETFAFLGLAVYFARWTAGPLVVAAGLGGSLLVSYAQARGETVNVSGSGGLMQRAERLVLMLLGCLFDRSLSHLIGRPEGTLLFGALVLIAVGSLGTAVHRTLWIARRLRA